MLLAPSTDRPGPQPRAAAQGPLPAAAARVLPIALALAGCIADLAAHPSCSRAATLTGFLSAPTDQVAVPGVLAGGEITPEGDLYTGWAEYELRVGRRLEPWSQPTRRLADPSQPLLSSTMLDGSVRYTQSVFAIAVGDLPVAYVTVAVGNESNRPAAARVEMALAYTRGRQIRGAHGMPTGAYRYERPAVGQPEGSYSQPGRAFSAGFEYSTSGRDLLSSGALLARGPDARSLPFATPCAPAPTAARDGRLFVLALRRHGSASLTWQVPLTPPVSGAGADRALDAMPLPRARAQLTRAWSAEDAGMMQVDVPEAKVRDTYRAAVNEMLASRYRGASGWVQASNKLQYQAFWIRDGALETQALDLAGLHRQAAENLAFMDRLQRPDGLFISRPGQYDGFGEALWALEQHAALARQPGFAAEQLDRIGAAIGWLSSVTASDPLGLLPAANPHDDELAFGHITGDDLWAAAGLRSAVADAQLAGRPDLAARWLEVDRRFESSLGRAVSRAVARTGHIPPVLDAPGGQDWGNYYAAYPLEVLRSTSPAVRRTLSWARDHMAEGLATYDGGRSLHDYLAFSVFQTELAAGDAGHAVAGLYSELAHTTSTGNGWEWDVPPFGRRASPVNLSPHGTFAADYVALLRNMLVGERSGGVTLLAGASPAWLAPGCSIRVTDAPAAQGVVSFAERSTRHGENLSWRVSLSPETPLRWALPRWARDARDSKGHRVGAVIVLRGLTGSITVTFAGHRPRQSYSLAVAALDHEYRAHGLAAPLVATG
jgi:hypothetical protein